MLTDRAGSRTEMLTKDSGSMALPVVQSKTYEAYKNPRF